MTGVTLQDARRNARRGACRNVRAILAFAVVLIGCGPTYILPPPPPPLPGGDDCQAAEHRLIELEAWAKEQIQTHPDQKDDPKIVSCFRADGTGRSKTPAGHPFTKFCKEALADGREVRPDCIAKASSCEAVLKGYETPRGTACPP